MPKQYYKRQEETVETKKSIIPLIGILILVAGVIVGGCFTVFAILGKGEYQDKMNTLNAEISELNDEINKKNAEIQSSDVDDSSSDNNAITIGMAVANLQNELVDPEHTLTNERILAAGKELSQYFENTPYRHNNWFDCNVAEWKFCSTYVTDATSMPVMWELRDSDGLLACAVSTYDSNENIFKGFHLYVTDEGDIKKDIVDKEESKPEDRQEGFTDGDAAPIPTWEPELDPNAKGPMPTEEDNTKEQADDIDVTDIPAS